jgi:alpha-L-rhamnosidase
VTAQFNSPIRVTQTIKPVKVTETQPGVFVFDMGQSFAGHNLLRVRGKAGEKVTMRYAERLKKDGNLDTDDIAQHVVRHDPLKRFQQDEYILKGGGLETWEARFCYHGYQYVEVTGYPGKPTLESIEGKFHHSDVQPIGEFACSNELFNRIQTATHWSYLSNLQSIPTDCPHREKNGWTGDAHLAAEQGLLNYDSATVYAKWLNDLKDEMRPSGELPGIVPSSGWGYEWGNGPAWDSAYILIPWYMYEYLGDTRVLAEHYPTMKRYVDYLTSRAKGQIVSIGLGDWAPWKTETPVPVTSTGYYYRDVLVIRDAARILGKGTDARYYDELATLIRQDFAKEFVDEGGKVANGSQAAQSTALYQGVGQESMRPAFFKNLERGVESRGLDTGILGTKYLLHTLSEGGRLDLAYRITTQTTQPSWGWWLAQGGTTLWEQWTGAESRNHIMFGDISHWFYRWIAGIRPLEPGFKKVEIVPGVVGDLTWARAKHHSIYGPIAVEWRKTAEGLEVDVDIPANVTGVVQLPCTAPSAVTEGGKPADKATGVKLLGFDNNGGAGKARFEVGSGKYKFVVGGAGR